MEDQQEYRRRPTRSKLLWPGGIVASLTVVVVIVAVLIGYRYGITLWAWIKLLIVPAVIAAGGFWFNGQQRNREMEIADQRAQDEALQAYLDQMSQLLTDKERPLHKALLNDSLSTVARARTLTVLMRLDDRRKRSVVQFLFEAGLLTKDRAILDLNGAHLGKANLIRVNLMRANLSGANLMRAYLSQAMLSEADLSNAELSGAVLADANLIRANLSGANLLNLVGGRDYDPLPTHSNKETIIIGISGSSGRNNTSLRGANLRGADLTDALVSTEHLLFAKSLEGATMPDGQKYEDWLNSDAGLKYQSYRQGRVVGPTTKEYQLYLQTRGHGRHG